MIRSGSAEKTPSAPTGPDPSAPPPASAPEVSFQALLNSITSMGACYAALLHQNGVSIAEASPSYSAPHKRDELAILATALVASAQALARSLGAGPSGAVRQQFNDGGLVLQPLTPEHWLFVVVPQTHVLATVDASLPAVIPALQSLLAANPSLASARFKDDIEFADLSDLRFD